MAHSWKRKESSCSLSDIISFHAPDYRKALAHSKQEGLSKL
jgi:hypothetical protein